MSTDYKFEGWLAHDKTAVEGNMKWGEFKPKQWTETDVDIEISHCGICGSDIHTLRSGWGETNFPACVGHEIIGKAVKVGKNAKKGIEVGDRVGVGAQCDSCLECAECADGNENHCPKMINTFDGKWPNGDKSYGGYATHNRSPSHFVFKIPDGLSSADAAPMLCGGVTVYSPLKRNGCGPGKRVGIVGVGGLGHFGLLFAKALGADKVVAISRTKTKKEDTLKMGVDDFIATDEDKDWMTEKAGTLDLIVSTVSSPKMPLGGYLSLLANRGAFIQVGAPEDNLPGFSAFALIAKGAHIGGSIIGAPHEIEEMLEVAAKHKLKPWIEQRPMKEANQAVIDMEAGKARYRYVLVN